jgi:hypothetical protein
MLNQKYRDDAVQAFISGLNKPFGDILFSSRSVNLPSALALAQELEMNQQQFRFANAFATYIEHNRIHTLNNFPTNLMQFRKLPYNPAGGIVNNTCNSQQLAINPFNQNRISPQKAQPMEGEPSTIRFKTSFQHINNKE